MPDPNVFIDFRKEYYHNPVCFVFEVLGCVPDEWQCLVMEDVADDVRKIAIKSGHGVGKSTVLSWILIWYILTRYPSKAVVTAPTSGQLYDALFAELKSWIKKLPQPLQVQLESKAERIELISAPTSAFISARTSRAEKPEALQGVHSDNVLLIVDEASGVPEQIFEAATGSMSGHNATTILTGNPVRSSGYFYNCFHGLALHWKLYTVSCADSRLVSPEYIEEVAATYGEESNAFRIRVLGEFPLADDDTVISYELAKSAMERDIEGAPTTRATWGLDVARFGDDSSCLVIRKGSVVETPIIWNKLDLMQLVGVVKNMYDEMAVSERPVEILVDAIGMGAGVVDRLRELGLPARGINVSETPAMGNLYRNLRTELWFKLKDWLTTRTVKLPSDRRATGMGGPCERLLRELISVKFKFTSTGKMQLESKDDMRKRKLGSPDVADALVLTMAGDAATAMYGTAAGRGWDQPIRRNLNLV